MKRLSTLALTVVLASCTGTAVPTTTAPAATTTTTTTTIASTTTTTSLPATTTSRIDPGPIPQLIMANEEGINVLYSGGTASYLARPTAVAFSDLRDGFVYQETTSGYGNWYWDEGAARVSLEWIEGSGPPAIMWLPAEGDPTVLVPADQALVTPLQVVTISGDRTLVYSAQQPSGHDCAGWPGTKDECAWQSVETRLVMRDLDDGVEIDLGFVSGYESGFLYWTFGNDRAAFVYNAYADEGAWTGVIEFPVAGGASLSGIAFDPQGNDFVWGPEYLCRPGQECAAALRGAIAPDGSALALAYHTYEPGAVPRVEIIDLADGSTRLDVTIGGPSTWPTWIDFDGTNVLVGRDGDRGTDGPVFVDAGGWVTELDPTTRYAFRGITP